MAEVVGFKINGSTYEYDHEHLANLPTIDATPTANSTNAVQSGGVKSALDGLRAEIPTVDSTPTQGSTNAVRSGGVYTVTAELDARVEDLEQGASGSGLTDSVKSALLQIAQKVAYIDDDGQTYYNDLYNALYPPATLLSISAVYTQSGTVYDTDTLDSLKTDLVVTGRYSDSSTRTITGYVLSGTLTEGTSTITVSYGGKTTTFNVIVSESVNIQVYYKDVSILGNAPGSTDGSIKVTSQLQDPEFISAVFDAEAARYKIVDNGTHNRFRFYGITQDYDVETYPFTGITLYRIADATTVSGIDTMDEYTIDNTETGYKIIFVYLRSGSTVEIPDLVVTKL